MGVVLGTDWGSAFWTQCGGTSVSSAATPCPCAPPCPGHGQCLLAWAFLPTQWAKEGARRAQALREDVRLDTGPWEGLAGALPQSDTHIRVRPQTACK